MKTSLKEFFKDLLNKLTLKEVILSCLALLAALIMFIGMAFDLVNIVEPHGKYLENGFMLMDFKSFFITSYYSWAIVLLGILNWLQAWAFFASVAMIVLSYVYNEFTDKKGLINVCVLIACAVFTLFYMIEGIIYTNINSQTLNTISGDFKTLSFIPFIFVVSTIVAYFVVKYVLKDRPLISAKQTQPLENANNENSETEQVGVTSIEQTEVVATEQIEETKDTNGN